MPNPTVGTGRALFRTVAEFPTAMLALRARGSGGVLQDLSQNGHPVLHGSGVPANAAAPLWLPWNLANYLYYPGTAGNSLTVPNAGVVNTGYTITYADGTTATGSSATNPLTFGGTDVQFAGLKVKSIVFTSGLTGSFLASGATGASTTYSDGTNTWTFNRTATLGKLCLVERDCYLFSGGQYFQIGDSPYLDFAESESFTACILARVWGTESNLAYFAKKSSAAAGTASYLCDRGTSNASRGLIADGTNLVTAVAGAVTQGVLTLVTMVRDVGADTLTAYTDAVAGTPVADSTTATLYTTDPLRIGQRSGGGTPNSMEFFGFSLSRRVLSAAELTARKAALL